MFTTSLILTVYYDGQFFSVVFETHDETGCRAARRVFAMPPSDPEIYALVLGDYAALEFSESLSDDREMSPSARNPKRRQREAARAQQLTAPSTRAQAALQAQREVNGAAGKHQRAQIKRERAQAQFALRTQKKKEKHRGR